MRIKRIVAAVLTFVAVSCGTADRAATYNGGNIPNGSTGPGNTPSGPADAGTPCTTATQCPSAWTCQNGTCTPPENNTSLSLDNAPPVATPHYVYALNPSAASVARIDPATLEIEAIPVGPQPVGLSAINGKDAAIVLSQGDGSLSLVDSTNLPSKVIRVTLPRQYVNLSVSSDGAWAVVWPDPATAPPSGAEGVFAVVDLNGVRAGKPPTQTVTELAGGFRITDVIFRSDTLTGQSLRVYVFAKATVSSFDLSNLLAEPARLPLPASMSADVASRAIVPGPSGSIILMRSMTAPEIAYYDGTAIVDATIAEVATDLALTPDATAAVVALRMSSSLAYVRVPQDIQNPAGIQIFAVDGGAVGRVALPSTTPDAGLFAYAYSNVTQTKTLSRVDLPSGSVTEYALDKLIQEVTLSPDATSAVIIHRADPNTTSTDPYQAAVDKDEGYSIFDVGSGFWELQRTGTVRPTRYAYSPAGRYAGVALRDDTHQKFQLDSVNLITLVSTSVSLASTPLFMGTVPPAPGLSPYRVFVSQDHPAGRISVIALDTDQIRTVTGFTLNGEIQ